MRWYNTFKRRDGSYITIGYTEREWMDFQLWKYCGIAIISSLLATLVSGACLAYRIWDYDKDEKAPSIIGIVSALYFLIDYWKGWIVNLILTIVEDDKTIRLMAHCNLAILITHIILLIFGDTIFFNIVEEDTRKGKLLVYSIIFLVITFLITIPVF